MGIFFPLRQEKLLKKIKNTYTSWIMGAYDEASPPSTVI